MSQALKKAWEGVLRPLLLRSKPIQVAALCYRETGDGKDVLLITSRDTGRWILPKGWPIDGMDGPQSALQEAWEEAGVRTATIDPAPVGEYDYEKGLDTGGVIHVSTQVYRAEVQALSREYPEVEERTRRWVSPVEAANLVEEPGLKDILRDF